MTVHYTDDARIYRTVVVTDSGEAMLYKPVVMTESERKNTLEIY